MERAQPNRACHRVASKSERMGHSESVSVGGGGYRPAILNLWWRRRSQLVPGRGPAVRVSLRGCHAAWPSSRGSGGRTRWQGPASGQGAAAGMGFQTTAVRSLGRGGEVPSESGARLPSCPVTARRSRVPRSQVGGPSIFRVQLLDWHPAGGPVAAVDPGWGALSRVEPIEPVHPGVGPRPTTRLSVRRQA